LAVVAWHGTHPVSAAGSTLASFDGVKAITMVFGSKDAEPNIWDGSASLNTGTIEGIVGYLIGDN